MSEKPILQLGFVSLGKTGVIILLAIILIFGFVAGYLFYKARRMRTSLRIDVAQTDMGKFFSMLQKDVEKLETAQQTPTPADDEFATQKIKDDIQKMGTYLKKEIDKAKE